MFQIDGNYLTIDKANNIYVNESGDKMTGNLDMKNHKIVNLGDPGNPDEAINKRYLDHVMRMQVTTVENMIESGKTEVQGGIENKLKDGLDMKNKKIKNLGDPINPDEAVNKKYVDTSMRTQATTVEHNIENAKTEVLGAIERKGYLTTVPPIYRFAVETPVIYGYVLNIGTSNTQYKISKFNITNISQSPYLTHKLNFQITPYLDTKEYHDEISMVIRNYEVVAGTVKIEVLTTRNKWDAHEWGLHLKAYLLVSVFENTPQIELTPVSS